MKWKWIIVIIIIINLKIGYFKISCSFFQNMYMYYSGEILVAQDFIKAIIKLFIKAFKRAVVCSHMFIFTNIKFILPRVWSILCSSLAFLTYFKYFIFQNVFVQLSTVMNDRAKTCAKFFYKLSNYNWKNNPDTNFFTV